MADPSQVPDTPTSVECRAAKDPAVRLFIFAAMLAGFGAWCFVDGYVRGKPAKVETLNDRITYYLNHVGGIVLPVSALVPLGWAAALLRRRLLADQEGIGYAGKTKVPWTAVTGLDGSRLADKGILYLHYDLGGRQETLTLDSWRLQDFRELVVLIEKKVPVPPPSP